MTDVWSEGNQSSATLKFLLRILTFSSALRRSTQNRLWVLPTFLPRDSDRKTCFRRRIRVFVLAQFNHMWPIEGLQAGGSLLATPCPTVSASRRKNSPALRALLSSL